MAKEVFCTFGIDVDAVAGWLGSYGGEDSPCDITRGLFAGEIGSPRLLKLFDKYGISTTWFIPGHSIETFPKQMQMVADAGHEGLRMAEPDVFEGERGHGGAVHPQVDTCPDGLLNADGDRARRGADAFVEGDQRAGVVTRLGALGDGERVRHSHRAVRRDRDALPLRSGPRADTALLLLLGAHGEAAAVLRDDACGLEPVRRIGCEGRLQLVGPAELGQGHTVQSVLLRRRD